MGKQQTNHRGRGNSLGALALGLCLVLFLVGAVLARYQHQFRSDDSVRAKEFYFTSDFLDGETHTLAPGSTGLTFTLGNHADDLRISEMDIDYTVTVEPAATVTPASGTLAKGAKADAEITLSNLRPGTYTVTAVGKGGFSKTLTATVVVPAEAARAYYHIDAVPGEYILLTVWNEGEKAQDVTIQYTGIPDNTNPNMSGWTTNGTKKITVDPHSSMVFRFFGGEITVTEAENKEPS